MSSALAVLDKCRNWREMWNPRASMSLTATKGLLNAPGENNCFLNSAVQVLWHLDVFRRSFRQLSGHACMGTNSCIFCALKVIFTQFQFSDQTALPPDAMRRALAKSFQDQQRFQLGFMDDAAECFENILLRIHFHIANEQSEDMCNAPHCITHQKFAMAIVEQLQCPCGATSEPLPYTQMVHYVSASTLVSERKVAKSGATFGTVLRKTVTDDFKNCPSGCGLKVNQQRSLMNCPDVVSVGLIWDSDHPRADHIRDVVRAIGTRLRMSDMFHSVMDTRWADSTELHLVGVVCYYGKHYSTFFFHSKMQTWVSFDDANVKEMGSDWEAVVDKCCRGHYQPLLLLFANPDAIPMDIETAPQTTTMLPGSHFPGDDSRGGGPSFHGQQPPFERDGSATTGGRTSGNPNMHFETSLRRDVLPSNYNNNNRDTRRAVTPNPDQQRAPVCTSRRAVTPGPEYGKYSSEDEADSKLEIVHKRQPSYLSAMDGYPDGTAPVGPYANATAPLDAMNYNDANNLEGFDFNHEEAVQRQQPPNMYVCQTNGRAGRPEGVDLLGSIPHARNSAPTSTYQPNGYYSAYNPAPPTNISHMTQANNWRNSSCPTASQSQTAYPMTNQSQTAYTMVSHAQQPFQPSPQTTSRSNFVTPVAPYSTASCVARVSEVQKLDHPGYPQQAPGYGYGYPQGAQTVTTQATGLTSSVSSDAVSNMMQQMADAHIGLSAPSTPALKRAQSSDTVAHLTDNPTLQSSQQQQQQQQPHPKSGLSRSRPHSARPFDYGNQRPTVDPKTGSIIMPIKQTQHSHQDQVIAQPPYDRQDSSATKVYNWNSQTQAPDTSSDEEKYGNYISRRAVESILSKQKKTSRPSFGVAGTTSNTTCLVTAAHAPITSSMKTTPIHSSNSSLESFVEQNMKHRRAIAGDTSSGMRDLKVEIPDNISLGSKGDSGYRSGGSSGDRNSASSTSSTSFDSPTVDNYRGFPGMSKSHHFDSHSSSESLNSNQSNQSHSTVKTIQNNRLSLIPENNMSSNSSSTLTVNRSGDSLSNSQDDLDKRSLTPNYDLQDDSPTGMSETQCMQAEELMDTSNKRAETGDLHAALVSCNQAIGCLQQALSHPSTGQEALVRVRMKHNTCVLRSRHLHRQILQRQQSSSSSTTDSLPYGDHNSLSSSSSDSMSHNKNSDLMCVEMPPKQQYQTLQDKVQELYQKQQGSTVASRTGYHDKRPEQQPPLNHIPRSSTDSALSQHYQRRNSSEEILNIAHSRQSSSDTFVGSHSRQSSAERLLDLSAYRNSMENSLNSGSRHNSQERLLMSATHSRQNSNDTITGRRPRNHSASDDLDEPDYGTMNSAKSVEIYGTLPKRKGAKSLSPSQPSDQDVYQGYMERQKAATDSMKAGSNSNNQRNSGGGGNGLVINHARQWSKEEIRDILMKDFVKKPGPSTLGGQSPAPEAPTPQPISAAYVPQGKEGPQQPPALPQKSQGWVRPGGEKPTAGPPLSQRTLPLPPKPQSPPKPKTQKPPPPQRASSLPQGDRSQGKSNNVYPQAPNSEGHSYNQNVTHVQNSHPLPGKQYLPPKHQYPAPPLKQYTPSEPSCKETIYDHPKQMLAQHQKDLVKWRPEPPPAHTKPTSESYRLSKGPQPETNFPKPSVIGKMDKIHQRSQHMQGESQIPPLPQKMGPGRQAMPALNQHHNPHGDPTGATQYHAGDSIPASSLGPALGTRQTSFEGPVPTEVTSHQAPPSANPSHLQHPPPAYPQPPAHQSQGHTPAGQGHVVEDSNQCTCNGGGAYCCPTVDDCDCCAGNCSCMLPPPPPELLEPDPSPCQCDEQDLPLPPPPPSPSLDRVPPSPQTSPPKPALTKKKQHRKPGPRKSVKFSEDVALISAQTGEEQREEVDYMQYARSMLKRSAKPKVVVPTTGDSSDDNLSDSAIVDDPVPNQGDKVLCTLCRQKAISVTEIYCIDCSYYMSKFQPQGS